MGHGPRLPVANTVFVGVTQAEAAEAPETSEMATTVPVETVPFETVPVSPTVPFLALTILTGTATTEILCTSHRTSERLRCSERLR